MTPSCSDIHALNIWTTNFWINTNDTHKQNLQRRRCPFVKIHFFVDDEIPLFADRCGSSNGRGFLGKTDSRQNYQNLRNWAARNHTTPNNIFPSFKSRLLNSVNWFALLTLRANFFCLSPLRSDFVQKPPVRISSKTALPPALLSFRYHYPLFQ